MKLIFFFDNEDFPTESVSTEGEIPGKESHIYVGSAVSTWVSTWAVSRVDYALDMRSGSYHAEVRLERRE